MNTIGHLINGKKIADAKRTQDVFNPSTGEVQSQVALASKTTVEEAIAAAQAAYPGGAIHRRQDEHVSCFALKNYWSKMPKKSVS